MNIYNHANQSKIIGIFFSWQYLFSNHFLFQKDYIFFFCLTLFVLQYTRKLSSFFIHVFEGPRIRLVYKDHHLFCIRKCIKDPVLLSNFFLALFFTVSIVKKYIREIYSSILLICFVSVDTYRRVLTIACIIISRYMYKVVIIRFLFLMY